MHRSSRPLSLLVVTQAIPSVTGMGVAMRLGNWLEAASAAYSITLLIVSADPKCTPDEVDPRWTGLCRVIHLVNVADQARRAGHTKLARRLTRRTPAIWDSWPLDAVGQGLEKTLASDGEFGPFDAALIFRLRLWPIWEQLVAMGTTARRVVLDLDDVESEAIKRQLNSLGTSHYGRLGFLLETLEISRLKRAQREVMKRVDLMTLASHDDLRLLAPMEHGLQSKVRPIANAVRLPEPLPPRTPFEANDRQPLSLLFIGALNYPPNEQALRWWLKDVEPLLRRAMGVRAPKLRVVGRFPPAWMTDWAGLDLHANVPAVRPYFQDCDALVVPLLSGGGTRIKIIEAMAYGRPVISTSIGAEGLNARPGVDYMAADTPLAFLQAIETLDRNLQQSQAMVRRGLELVRSHFSLEVVGQEMLNCLSGP